MSRLLRVWRVWEGCFLHSRDSSSLPGMSEQLSLEDGRDWGIGGIGGMREGIGRRDWKKGMGMGGRRAGACRLWPGDDVFRARKVAVVSRVLCFAGATACQVVPCSGSMAASRLPSPSFQGSLPARLALRALNGSRQPARVLPAVCPLPPACNVLCKVRSS